MATSCLMASQLPAVVGLPPEDIRALIDADVFPRGHGCRGWDEASVRSWGAALRSDQDFAESIALLLGRRRLDVAIAAEIALTSSAEHIS